MKPEQPAAGYVPNFTLEERFHETGHLSTGTISVVAGADPEKTIPVEQRQPIGYAAPKPKRRRARKASS